MSNLAECYGREVPTLVKLNGNFDKESDCNSKPGDTVTVVKPPDGVEIDGSSIWVELLYGTDRRKTRIYDHEYEAAR